LLLSDFFESFRDTSIKDLELDPSYFTGLPGYSQNAMLNFTKTELHFIPDVNVSRLIINNLRGGFSGIVNKVFKERKNVIGKYWDVNNLYGYAMIQKLANEYLGELSLDGFNAELESYDKGGDYCYFVLCDYSIPEENHEKFERFAPLINKKTVTMEDLSELHKSIKNVKNNYKSEKLISSLEPGTNYLCSYENYLFYKRIGYDIEIKAVHKFRQEYIARDYINYNTAQRQKATSDLLKNLFKLLNNIIYGKSLESPEKWSTIELLSEPKTINNRVTSPLLKSVKIIEDDKLVLTEMFKNEIKYPTCIQMGFHILEISKNLMYTTLYDKIFPFVDEKNVGCRLLMHDTDSFFFEFDLNKSEYATADVPCKEGCNDFNLEAEINFMKDFKEAGIFDLHIYNDARIKDVSNKKSVGFFLDEYSDRKKITGYIGLCSKSYCYMLEDVITSEKLKEMEEKAKAKAEEETKVDDDDDDDDEEEEKYFIIKGKGISTRFLEAMYDFEDYVNANQNKLVTETVKFKNIKKSGFKNVITDITKKTLTGYDDKFFLYKEGEEIRSLPYGHYKINQLKL
jgi:hypothetical protein